MKKIIIAALKKELLNNLENHNEYIIIRAMLIKYTGMAINEQIVLADGYGVKFLNNGFYVSTPRGEDHFICFAGDCENFSIDNFDAVDFKHAELSTRNARQLQYLIDNPDGLIDIFTRLSAAKDRLKTVVGELMANSAFTNDNPAYIGLLALIGIKDSFIRRVHNNRFN